MKQEMYRDYSPKEALEAVKRDGYALQYVKEQSEALCLEAVKQNGDALRYVDERCLACAPCKEMTVAEINEALGFDVRIVKERTQ